MPRTLDYDTIADSYDRRYSAPERYAGVERVLLEFLGADGGRVLEAGCGTGHWLEVAARRAAASAVAGIDPARGMLARARRRVPAADLVCGKAEALPWRDGSFQRLYCVNAYHHFARPFAFLAEAHRVLDPDGALLIVGLDPHSGLDRWWIYDFFAAVPALDRQRYPAGQRLREALDAAGFCRIGSFEAHRWTAEVPARAALDAGLADRDRTSQLTLLAEEEYRQGLERLREAMAEKEAAGEELTLAVDLRLWATVGWMRARGK